MLNVRITHDPKTLRTLERFKLLARIDAGELPVLHSPLILQRGEVCHAEFPSNLHEIRTVTKRVNYHGPSGRIRIMKGLSWRYGSVSMNRVTSEELRQLDSGVLYITNKRLIFNGALKNLNIPFKKIIHFTVYQDGIRIEKETGRVSNQFSCNAVARPKDQAVAVLRLFNPESADDELAHRSPPTLTLHLKSQVAP